jgi:uncharacterized protein YrrD
MTKEHLMPDLVLGAPVDGRDAAIGRLTAVVCEPLDDRASHLVVEADAVPGSERLVPLDEVADQGTRITLNITREAFFELDVLEMPMPGRASESSRDPHRPSPPLPSVRPSNGDLTYALHEHIPPDDVALRRDTRVTDRSGHHVGHLHALVVARASHELTHIVVQRRHLIRRDDITLPMSAVLLLGEREVWLALESTEINGLPHIVLP